MQNAEKLDLERIRMRLEYLLPPEEENDNEIEICDPRQGTIDAKTLLAAVDRVLSALPQHPGGDALFVPVHTVREALGVRDA